MDLAQKVEGGGGCFCRSESSGGQGCWAVGGQLTVWGQGTMEAPVVHAEPRVALRRSLALAALGPSLTRKVY